MESFKKDTKTDPSLKKEPITLELKVSSIDSIHIEAENRPTVSYRYRTIWCSSKYVFSNFKALSSVPNTLNPLIEYSFIADSFVVQPINKFVRFPVIPLPVQ